MLYFSQNWKQDKGDRIDCIQCRIHMTALDIFAHQEYFAFAQLNVINVVHENIQLVQHRNEIT